MGEAWKAFVEETHVNSVKQSIPSRVIYLLIHVLFPIVIILTSVRLVLYTADTWVKIEYRMPGFPVDLYGFSLDDRIYWSAIDIDYLLTEARINYFDEFTLDDGSPMHNDRELSHMQDVKNLLDTVWKVWASGIFFLLTLVAVLWWMDDRAIALRAVIAGSKLTVLLMIFLVIFLVHIGVGLFLFYQNRQVSNSRYSVSTRVVNNSFASETMPYTGLFILAFLIVHISGFTFSSGNVPISVTVKELLGSFFYGLFYILSFIALAIHLSHGFWSMLQTFGINHPRYNYAISKLTLILPLIFLILFAGIPLYFMTGLGASY